MKIQITLATVLIFLFVSNSVAVAETCKGLKIETKIGWKWTPVSGGELSQLTNDKTEFGSLTGSDRNPPPKFERIDTVRVYLIPLNGADPKTAKLALTNAVARENGKISKSTGIKDSEKTSSRKDWIQGATRIEQQENLYRLSGAVWFSVSRGFLLKDAILVFTVTGQGDRKSEILELIESATKGTTFLDCPTVH
jgi:hypothetical protein